MFALTAKTVTRSSAGRVKLLTSAAASLATFCVAAPALAQTSSAQPDTAEVPDIVVTAQKRSERIIDVPISISAVDSRTIERTGAANLEDVGRQVANVVLPDSAFDSRPQITIRGVFSNVRNSGFEDGVVVYLDQVPVGRREGFNIAVDDLEQIEVLRGPQGTLFGKNSISGAINITSKKPQYDETSAAASAQYGSYDLWSLHGSLNIPIIDDKAAIRLSAGHSQRDGYVTNVFNGSKLGSNNVDNFRGQLKFDVGGSLTVLVAADYMAGFSTIAPQEPLAGAGFVPGPYSVNYNAPDNFEDRKTGGAALTLDYGLGGGMTLTSITSYRFAKVHLTYDQDLSPLDLYTVDFRDHAKQFSQEVRLTSPSAKWGSFVVGGQYFWQRADFDRPVPGGSLLGGGLLGTTIGNVTTNTYAAFGHVDVKITDKLTAFGGLRYTADSKRNAFEQIFSATGSAVFGLPTIPRITGSRSDSSVTYAVGLRYAPDRNSSIYASISTGFKGGGFNDDFVLDTNPNGFSFGPETATNYEVGYKGDFFDRRLSIHASAFYLDYNNLQVSNFNGLSYVIRNAASARSKGAELEVTTRPLRGLVVAGSVGYTDAHFLSYVLQPGVDYSGNPLLRAPRWTASGSIDYAIAITDDLLVTPRVDYSYVSSQYSGAATTPSNFIPSSGIGNARVSVGRKDGRWEASAWVKNLTNKHALADAFFFISSDVVNYVPPRTFGVDISLKF